MLSDAFYAAILIACLDSHSFAVRQSAEDALAGMEARAIPYLTLARGRSPEQSMRLERLRRRQTPVLAAAMCGNCPPWIDACADSGVPGLYLCAWRGEFISAYVDRARHMPARFPKPYPEYRLATYLLAGDLLSSGHSYAEVAGLVERLRRRCRGWDGSGPPPPE